MQDLIERERTSAAADAIPDRRRPGRLQHENPHLVELLRRLSNEDKPRPNTAPGTGLSDRREDGDGNDLSAAAGIGLAMVLGSAAWVSCVSVLWLLFGH